MNKSYLYFGIFITTGILSIFILSMKLTNTLSFLEKSNTLVATVYPKLPGDWIEELVIGGQKVNFERLYNFSFENAHTNLVVDDVFTSTTTHNVKLSGLPQHTLIYVIAMFNSPRHPSKVTKTININGRTVYQENESLDKGFWYDYFASTTMSHSSTTVRVDVTLETDSPDASPSMSMVEIYVANAPQAYTCTSPIENAKLCSNDNSALTRNSTSTAVDTCSIPEGSVPKCEYKCNVGYMKDPHSKNRCLRIGLDMASTVSPMCFIVRPGGTYRSNITFTPKFIIDDSRGYGSTTSYRSITVTPPYPFVINYSASCSTGSSFVTASSAVVRGSSESTDSLTLQNACTLKGISFGAPDQGSAEVHSTFSVQGWPTRSLDYPSTGGDDIYLYYFDPNENFKKFKKDEEKLLQRLANYFNTLNLVNDDGSFKSPQTENYLKSLDRNGNGYLEESEIGAFLKAAGFSTLERIALFSAMSLGKMWDPGVDPKRYPTPVNLILSQYANGCTK